MKKILNIFIILTFVLSIQSTLESKTEIIQLKVPVRVYDKNILIENLSKNDFTVSINNENVEISSIKSVKRGMSHPTTPFRNFVLSFNLYHYGEQVGEAIEHFVKNILTDSDEIMIITPENVYKFSADESKEKTIDDIKKLVKDDSQIFKGKRTTYENNLKEILRTSRLPDVSSPSRGGAAIANPIMKFLKSYQTEWLTFKNRFLLPDVNKYKAVSSYFFGKDGDKWFINFQQREIIPELGELKTRIDEIRDSLSEIMDPKEQAWVPMIEKSARELEKSLLFSDMFPQDEIQDILMSSNISYDVILFRSKVKMEGGVHEMVSPDYEDILRNISRATGGSTLETTDIKNGLLQLSQHQDTSYLLDIPISPVPVNIDIKLQKSDYETYHKKTYSGAEIKDVMQISADKVKISGVSVKDKIVKFIISNFSTDESQVSKSEGNLDVKMLIIDERGNTAYKTGNILKTFKDSITITLPPLDHIRGKNKVFIFAEDKIRGISSVFTGEFVF